MDGRDLDIFQPGCKTSKGCNLYRCCRPQSVEELRSLYFPDLLESDEYSIRQTSDPDLDTTLLYGEGVPVDADEGGETLGDDTGHAVHAHDSAPDDLQPCQDQDEVNSADSLLEDSRTGQNAISIRHSDQGKNLVGKVFSAVCRLLDIHKIRTTAYRPSANGQVERFNNC